MAFQALLFCPDDKTARIVTQVLSELEFNVAACIEPFAAVKKLMSGHFDALVVDCDNEQNATLLFKSARNSTSNQTSLAVAIVEGQAGVAKAFRIGANLVLTKPINIEQSKGTLRVARGLLRRGEPAKPPAPTAVPATAAAPTGPTQTAKPTIPKPVAPAKPATTAVPAPAVARRPVLSPLIEPPTTVAAAQAAASSGLADPDEILEIKGGDSPYTAQAAAPAPLATSNKISPAPLKPPAVPPDRPEMRPPFAGAAEGPAGRFGGGAASAPALAREAQIHATESIAPGTPHRAEDLFEKPAESARSSASHAAATEPAPAPSFTFGGANASSESGGAGKKILLGVAAAVVVGAILYVGWSHFQSPASRPERQAPVEVSTPSGPIPGSTRPAPPNPAAAQPAARTQPSNQAQAVSTLPTTTAADGEATDEGASAESRPSEKPSASPASQSVAPGKPAEAPLVVKGGAAPATKPKPAADTPAPNLTAIAATGSGGALSNLVASGETPPQPVLQSVNISQGVSQGLLLKKVQPAYPRTALTMHVEGIVDLLATISKTGDITAVKVLSGDRQLTPAAVDAVKKWKYKPYLLNGEPVEIQTQVTISFKLPH
jgi:protein TonB